VDPVEIFISPLLFRGKIAALVYGDSGNSAEGILSSDALDILTRVASMSIDLIPMKQKAAPARPAATAAPAAVPAPAAARPAAPAAPAPQEAPAPSPAPAPRVPAAAPPLEGLSDDEKKSHNDARRLARVLVSDLLLYNEAKVAAGRKNKNLYDLLRDDIERSRQLYQQRVPPKVAQVSNYFTEELLNTLAQGDASALKGYPGLA
jgi:pyruvate/2-oxoglutarate dehydrogenase complex dihydrolipoamide acyltransferase (E2) component